MRNTESAYYTLFGSSVKRALELGDEKTRWQNELRQRYPFSTKTDCVSLAAMIVTLQADLDKVTQDIANGATDQVGKRWQAVAGDYKVQMVGQYNKMQCEVQREKEERTELLDENLALLDKAGNVATKTSKTATYIIIGSIAVVFVVAGIILFKSLSKKQ